MGLNFLLADLEGPLFLLLVFRVDSLVLFRGDPQHLAQRCNDILGRHQVIPRGADAVLLAPGRVDNDMIPGLQFQVAGVKKIDLTVGAEMDIRHLHRFFRPLFRLCRFLRFRRQRIRLRLLPFRLRQQVRRNFGLLLAEGGVFLF